MNLRPTLLVACALAIALPAAAAPYRSAQQILDASPATDWRTPAPENTLYMELDAGRVVIELAPGFAPQHVANIRTLAREGFWDGTSVYRVQDNFVAQFGDAEADDPAKASPGGGGSEGFQRSMTAQYIDTLRMARTEIVIFSPYFFGFNLPAIHFRASMRS